MKSGLAEVFQFLKVTFRIPCGGQSGKRQFYSHTQCLAELHLVQ